MINGSDGLKAGHDVISSIVDAIIEPSIQAQITWTGKTSGTVKKKSFEDLVEIQSLILTVCRKADHAYTKADFLGDLKYKVIKCAHGRW